MCGGEGAAHQGVAFVVGQVGGQVPGQGLLEHLDLAGAGGVEHATGERDGLGRERRPDVCAGAVYHFDCVQLCKPCTNMLSH